MQPVDSVELTISLKNDYKSQTDWYMKNEVLETLEKSDNAAEGGAYDYLLTYTDTEGVTTTLYESEKLGGDGKKNGEGLLGATKTLDEYFYLGRLGNGDAGTVKLKVALDGETLVGAYQNTLASLQMDFAVELVSSTSQTTSNRPKSVRTGDEANIMLYVILALAAGLVFLLMAILRLRSERRETVSEAEQRTPAPRSRRRRR